MRVFWNYKERMRNKRPIPWEGMPIWSKAGGWGFVEDDRGFTDAKIEGHIYYLGSYSRVDDRCFYLPGERDAPFMSSNYMTELLNRLSKCSYSHMISYHNGEWAEYTGPPNVQKALFLPDIPNPFSLIYPYNGEKKIVVEDPCRCGGPSKLVHIGISGAADTTHICSICGKEK